MKENVFVAVFCLFFSSLGHSGIVVIDKRLNKVLNNRTCNNAVRPPSAVGSFHLAFGYDGSAHELGENTRNDNAFFESVARRNGFANAAFTDMSMSDQLSPEIQKTELLKQISKSAKGKLDFLFTYSGHGVVDEKNNWYAVIPAPKGADTSPCLKLDPNRKVENGINPRTLAREKLSVADLNATFLHNNQRVSCRHLLLSMREVHKALSSQGVQNTALFLDGCHSQAATNSLSPNANAIVFYASAANQLAGNGEKGNNGYFTEQIKQALNNPTNDLNKDGRITLDEFAFRVSEFSTTHRTELESQQFNLSGQKNVELKIGDQTVNLYPTKVDEEVIEEAKKRNISLTLQQVPGVDICGTGDSPLMNIVLATTESSSTENIPGLAPKPTETRRH